ncbi:MAG: hypothetical protein M1812_004714, partial [Candelaria pacifica]
SKGLDWTVGQLATLVGGLVCVEGVWWREFWGGVDGGEVMGDGGGDELLVDEGIDDDGLRVGESAGLSEDENIWGEGWERDEEVGEGNYDDYDEDVFSQTSMVVPFMLQR